MKKNYLHQAVLIACSLAVTAMTSCKDDETIESTTTVETGYYVKVSEDVLATTEVVAHYVDATGKLRSESVTTTEWKKQLPKGSLPTSAALWTQFKPKDVNTTTKYNMELTSCVAYRIEDGNGKQWSDAWTAADNNSSQVTGEQVPAWCAKNSITTAIEIQTDGISEPTTCDFGGNPEQNLNAMKKASNMAKIFGW